ncbi:MAG: hypothetical protein O7D95_06170 [Betaproteobacteria bacterium]|nr:hypothetical protein [Betaproteobacteria bacterium]
MADFRVTILPGTPELPEDLEIVVNGLPSLVRLQLVIDDNNIVIISADSNGDINEIVPINGYELELANFGNFSKSKPTIDWVKGDIFKATIELHSIVLEVL